MSRKPEDIKDWEKVLAQTSFDLPEASWQRMENDLRAFLAAESRKSAPAKVATEAWYAKLLGWFSRPVGRWGVALSCCALAAAAFYGRSAISGQPAAFAWVPGQVLEGAGRQDWSWTQGRCRIQGNNTRLVLNKSTGNEIGIELERGEATFQVDHRRPEEAFSVKVGDCQVHVVGTTFTVGIDSLRQWVAVEEGLIRFEGPKGRRMVARGESGVCSELGSAIGASRDTVVPDAPAQASSAVAVAPGAGTKQVPQVPVVVVPSCTSGESCIRELSAFVRGHADHSAASEIALRWARLAAAKGDHRDAMVAYAFAIARGDATADIARLESYGIRIRSMNQSKGMADSLDPWIERLPVGGAVWREALTLRKDVARRAGDVATVARIESRLQSTPKAEIGDR